MLSMRIPEISATAEDNDDEEVIILVAQIFVKLTGLNENDSVCIISCFNAVFACHGKG